MIMNQYQIEVNEMTNATLSFIESRPVMKLILWGMKIACLAMLAGFLIKAYTQTLTSLDLGTTLFAMAWLCFRRKINAFFLKKNLSMRKAEQFHKEYHLSPYKIWWKENATPQQLLWQEVPCVLAQRDGYMIPLTGMAQSGRFLWLPKRGFKDESGFLELLKKKSVKLKKIV